VATGMKRDKAIIPREKIHHGEVETIPISDCRFSIPEQQSPTIGDRPASRDLLRLCVGQVDEVGFKVTVRRDRMKGKS
jgi:hypothetical protein